MRNKSTQRCGSALAALVLIVGAGMLAQAQNQQPPSESAQTQTQTQAPPNQIPDLGPLNLTQDQIQRIRIINAELKDQRQAAGLRLRLAHRALTEAIESPTPNEALIDQRSRELAEAQAATIRIRSLAESRILQVLTPEQRVRLREIRQQNQAGRRGNDQQLPRNRALRRQDGAQGNNNTLAPLRPAPRRQQRRP